ncbi:MAG: type II secretion system minor pseudopilin GspK [Pseudomonadota bacterium]
MKTMVKPSQHRQYSQQGIALITAVLVAALITAGAVAMAATHRFGLQRGINQIHDSHLLLAVQQTENSAGLLLTEDLEHGALDSLSEDWALETIGLEVSAGTVMSNLIDMQALFNLTNLSLQFGQGTGGGANAAASNDAFAATSNLSAANTGSSFTQPFADTAGNLETNTGLAAPSASSADPVSGPRQVFDWAPHREFITQYVQNCVGENQQCAREARHQVLQQFGPNAVAGNADAIQAANSANDARASTSALSQQPSALSAATDLPPAGLPGATSGGVNNQAKSKQTLSVESQLKALFRALDLNPEPIQAILDWVDEDSETRYPNGAEDEYYTGLDTPYRAANGPFATVRELLLVRGINREVFEKLAPHLVILPQATPINVNTASADAMMSIHPMIDRTTAELIIEARRAQPFQSTKAFLAHPALFGLEIGPAQISVASEYFQLNGTANSQGVETYHRSLLRRSNGTVNVVRRARGYFE